MRVAYLVSRYPLVSHTFILREVSALRRAGAQIDTFTIRRSGEEHLLSPEDQQADATTYAIVPPRPSELVAAHCGALVRRPRRYLSTLRLALRLTAPGARAALWQLFYFGEAVLMWHQCERRGITHIHTHHANVASDVALLAAHLGGESWSWSFTMHGPTELFDAGEHRLAHKARLARLVVCGSYYARSQVMGMIETSHWSKLRVVHSGVDLSLWDGGGDRESGGAGEVLAVGRAVPVKGHALLIEALAEVRRRGVDARLTIVGDGPSLPELRALAGQLDVSDRVELAGSVGQDRIRDQFRRADVFALPSFAEGLPTVVMEAMAMELPVVATWIAGVAELVEDGVSGLLVPPGRADALADGLERLLRASPEERRAMGGAGREKVRAGFELERSARQLLELFEQLAR